MMENSLPSGIDKQKLAKIFDEFRILPCPGPPENDDLYDLYSELMEYDGHVAGLVSSFLSGRDNINKAYISRNIELDRKIYSFPDGLVELQVMKNYYKKLDDMVHILLLLT